MMVYTRLLVYTALLAATLGYLQARSLAEREAEDIEGRREDLWQPPDGRDREEWLRCHGFSCDQWDRTQRKLLKLKQIATPNGRQMFNDNPTNGSSSLQPEGDSLDGCIWLTEEQVDALTEEAVHQRGGRSPPGKEDKEDKEGPARSRQKRKLNDFSGYPFGLWDLPVPWKFDGNHYEQQRAAIRGAISHWEQQTCVRFRELEVGALYSDSHLLITRQNSGCHSFIGRLRNSPQQLNLQDVCVGTFGIIVHEIGHALGLWHEQQRADRDDHIRVNFTNIGYYTGQFIKRNTVHLGVPYDVGSVMHYGQYSGSSNGHRVMTTIDPLLQNSLGQRTGLSYMDAKIINEAYCQDACTRDLPQQCQHGGYQDPNDCSVCRCPDGFSGTYCQHLAQSDAGCGADLVVPSDGSPVYITSPGYGVDSYDNRAECNWRIRAASPRGYHVQLEFVEQFAVYCHYSAQCHHWVEVKYDRETLHAGTQGARFCCYQRPDAIVTSEEDEMVIAFRSNWTASFAPSRRGFKARLTAVRDSAPKSSSTTTTATTTTTTTTPKPTPSKPSVSTTTTTTTTPKPTPAKPSVSSKNKDCETLDLALVLDSSGSVMQVNWYKVLTFSQQLISNFNISPKQVRVGVVSIGNSATAHITFTDFDEEMDLSAAINKIAFKDQFTNTGAGLRVAREDLFEASPRDGARKVLVLMTDGRSNKDEHTTLPQAQLARDAGIEVYVMAVGSQVDIKEATGIAGSEERVLRVNSFDALLGTGATRRLLTDMCEDMQTGVTARTLWSCSFESKDDELCGMVQDTRDDFNWTRISKPTPSQETGPSAAQDGDNYIFIEASNPRKYGDEAKISLPGGMGGGDRCISFYYHMFGFHVNSLKLVTVSSSGFTEVVWKRNLQQGDLWRSAAVDVNMASGDKLAFVAQCGKEFSGDIALDNIIVQEESCTRK